MTGARALWLMAAVAAGAGLAMGLGVVLTAPDSALPWSVLGAGRGASSSTSFELASTAGQSSPIGQAGSTNFSLGAGYWYGAGLDGDSDDDGISDDVEMACGSDPGDANSIPERVDGAFAGVDDDGNDGADEELPPGSESYDCDGDGWTGGQESLIFKVLNTMNDQDPCGNNGWPADLEANNILDIGDFGSFLFPTRGDGTFNKFGHPVPDLPYDTVRWNIEWNAAIDIGDIGALLFGITGNPPMFGGQPAFFTNGGQCPWPP